jgi:AraC-like DNA-binding protein
MMRLTSTHAAAARSRDSLCDPANPVEYVEKIEDCLTKILLDVVGLASAHRVTMGRQHHELIIRRFLEVLKQDTALTPRMEAISAAIGVSSRTLRLACQEQLGVSPTQYLLLRRMRLARRALQQANPDATTVTDIATILGFWELGRFAVRYRQIFGESRFSILRDPNGSGRGLVLSSSTA